MQYKIDLHTHSILSYDGGISKNEYVSTLESGLLNYIAITDHNEFDFGYKLSKDHPNKIIPGEEIMTKEGEVIGLYLEKKINKNLGLEETIDQIKEQGGIVYIPHPFSRLQYGIGKELCLKFKDKIDIIECFNSRAKLKSDNNNAFNFVKSNNIPTASSTDAHTHLTLGRSFSIVNEEVTKQNLISLLSKAEYKKEYAPSFREKFAPTLNVIKHLFIPR